MSEGVGERRRGLSNAEILIIFNARLVIIFLRNFEKMHSIIHRFLIFVYLRILFFNSEQILQILHIVKLVYYFRPFSCTCKIL